MSAWKAIKDGVELATGVGGAIFGGQDTPEQLPQNLHMVNPGQKALWDMFAARAMNGSGEFGFGQAAKQGKGQVQQFLADRGVDMGSGFAAGAMGDTFANAGAYDSANRNQFNLSLLQTPFQVAQASGANFLPGSPSTGGNAQDQADSWSGFFTHGGARTGGGWENPLGGARGNIVQPQQNPFPYKIPKVFGG